jgi:CHAT domain-containing protein/tetratricopeptide (TPR) repeat protein
MDKSEAEIELFIFNQIVAALYSQGNIENAIDVAEQAFNLARSIYPNENNNLVVSINNLAELCRIKGNLSAAEYLFDRAIEMIKKLFGNCDRYDLATSFSNLSLLYQSQGKLVEAKSLCIEALEMRRRLFCNCDHQDLATSINNLAGLYIHQRRFNAAELLLGEALSMTRRLCDNCDHHYLAISINNFAGLYKSQYKLNTAEPLFDEALMMFRRLYNDYDHHDLANSIRNLADLYVAQHKFRAAEPLLKEALAMCQRLFPERDHFGLFYSINSLADLYIAQKQTENAFFLMIEAVEVEENILLQWFGYSTESNRLNFVENNPSNLAALISFVCQYFPDDSEKIAQVAIAVARRKAFAAQAEIELNYQRYGDKYPDLAEDFQELATAQGKLTHLNHTYYHHQGAMDAQERESHQQVKQTLTERIDRLERKLSANVPELRQLQQQVTLPAIFAALPDDSCAIEFYHFNVYNFAANEWQSPQYVAFILAPGGNVRMVKLGDAGEIDGLIRRYRDLSSDANLPSFGARPNPSHQQPKSEPEVEDLSIDLQLSQRLLTPILEALPLVERSRNQQPQNLIFIPDGALHTLPIGNLLVGKETRLFQKVGFLGASLGELFICNYLSTLRELLTREDRPNRSFNPSIAIGNPNYNYPAPASTDPELVNTGSLASMRSIMSQVGVKFAPIPESQLLLDRLQQQLGLDARIFTGDRATETVLKNAKSPKLLVILTHGYLLDGERDRIQLIFKLLECPEGEELDLIQTYNHLIDRNFLRLLNAIGDYLDRESLNGGSFCRSFGEFLSEQLPELVDRESAQSIDPMQNHGLALAGANSWLAGEKLPADIGKGFLLARDVAYLDLLGTEIVFLIACSSGLGDVKTGEGVFGLRRAFAIAGVKQLITSLWDVPTRPTMLLMDRFFEAYHQGVSPAISLQSAQQYIRDISRSELETMPVGEEILDELTRYGVCILDLDRPLRHPYFWGAWICQGV